MTWFIKRWALHDPLFQTSTLNFLYLLIDNKRMDIIGHIVKEFEIAYNKITSDWHTASSGDFYCKFWESTSGWNFQEGPEFH